MSFRVGQRVRVNYPRTKYHGAICTVISPLQSTLVVQPDGTRTGPEWLHDVDLPVEGGIPYAFAPHELIPLDDHEPGSWSELSDIWVPDGVAS